MIAASQFRLAAWLLAAVFLMSAPASAATLTVTLTASEPVIVTGAPRIAIDVGGVTRYAIYAGSAGVPLTSLPFSYAVQAGDFDADGIDVTPQIDLNGATLTDRGGNPPAPFTFTKPDTTALKVQTYTTSFTSTSDLSAASFTIAKAPTGASFTYTVSSSSGSATVTGSGTIGSLSHLVSGVDLSDLPGGTLTLSVTISNVSGAGTAKTASVTPSFTGILDSLPSAAAAYSVRRLRAAYAGPLLRVRRSTDNVQQNIGFTIGGNLDRAALASFCGTASCYVTTWFEQSGNGGNLGRSNTGNQPRLVNAGSLELLGTRPALRFYGGQSLVAGIFPPNANELTFSLTAVERNRNNHFMWRLLAGTSVVVRAFMPWGDGRLVFDVGGSSGSFHLEKIWTVPIGTPAVVSFQNSASAGTRSVFVNGSLFLSGIGFAAPAGDFLVGFDYDGHIPEFIFFTSSIASSSRLTLEQSQGSYFGVTVQ